MNCNISEPIHLNCWKHHAGFIKSKINSVTKNSFQDLLWEIKVIGNGLMDLYFGKLSPEEISDEILQQLEVNNIFNKSEYKNWLNEEGSDFRNKKISDDSVWILRLGEDEKRFVHIHPARYSLHTFRIRAVSLKTAIVVNAYVKLNNCEPLDLKIVNEIRKEYLSESPVKSLSGDSGLGKLILLLE